MISLNEISLFAMSGVYILAGCYHFINPKLFLKITPLWVPNPELINKIVGSSEIILGIALLFGTTRHYAALGIIALLIAVFPANIFHFQKSLKKGKFIIPTLIRLPIQALLIYWAYTFV